MGGFFDWMFGGGDDKPEPAPQPQPEPTPVKDVGNVGDVGSLEQQASARRLARMSKYFTTPTGVMDGQTGSSGIF